MKRMHLLSLAAAIVFVLLQSTLPMRAGQAPTTPADSITEASASSQPIHVAWDRVGATA